VICWYAGHRVKHHRLTLTADVVEERAEGSAADGNSRIRDLLYQTILVELCDEREANPVKLLKPSRFLEELFLSFLTLAFS
jgi:hypothetical protein